MSSPTCSPPPPPGSWSCVRCTFLNPGPWDKCDVCEASRPVEVDVDSPVVAGAAVALASPERGRRRKERSASPPPQRFGRKRERDASPDVVNLCDSADKGPAAKKGSIAALSTALAKEIAALSTALAKERSASPPPQRFEGKREGDASPDVVDLCDSAGKGPAAKKGSLAALSTALAKERSASSPPQLFERKRESDASPDVVDLCDSAGKGPAAKKGNPEICLEKKTFKIMTYNVWFREDMELIKRMGALGDLIKQHSPDFICFQEVTPNIYKLMQKSGWWQQYKCSLSHEQAIQRPYYCMQLSKVPMKTSDCIPFSNSIMGRELCITTVSTGEMTMLRIGTTHLESPCPEPPKWDQMYSKERVDQAKQCLTILGRCSNAILCGDMNWDDKGDGPFPLQDGWTDAWVELKPGEDGWTYDTKANDMLSGNRKLQKRMDRFVCKLADFKIDSIEMIGKEAIPGVFYLKEKKIRKESRMIQLPVFPSDHFGLVLTISQQENDSF